MPKILKKFNFRKSKENGELSGKEIEHEVPEFDWESFKNIPNARLFVERAYNSALQKLVRDIHLVQNGTREAHIQSLESVIARSVKVTKTEIEEWCEKRDWDDSDIKDKERSKQILFNILPKFSSNDYIVSNDSNRKLLAEIVASVSDPKTDPIAEYLWVKLTQDPYYGSQDLIEMAKNLKL